jgi:hypothetical protein
VCRYIMFCAKYKPVPEATTDFGSRPPEITLSSDNRVRSDSGWAGAGRMVGRGLGGAVAGAVVAAGALAAALGPGEGSTAGEAGLAGVGPVEGGAGEAGTADADAVGAGAPDGAGTPGGADVGAADGCAGGGVDDCSSEAVRISLGSRASRRTSSAGATSSSVRAALCATGACGTFRSTAPMHAPAVTNAKPRPSDMPALRKLGRPRGPFT